MFLKCFINFIKIFISKNNPNKATVMQEIKCSGFVKHLVGDVLCFLVWSKIFLASPVLFQIASEAQPTHVS